MLALHAMRGYLTETRLVLTLVVVGLLTVWGSQDRSAFPPAAAPSSHTAVELADALAREIDRLPYDDPRLAPTAAYAVPDASLLPDAPGLRSTWKIREHEPARFMKTIEIRVRWSHDSRDDEIALTTVKAS